MKYTQWVHTGDKKENATYKKSAGGSKEWITYSEEATKF